MEEEETNMELDINGKTDFQFENFGSFAQTLPEIERSLSETKSEEKASAECPFPPEVVKHRHSSLKWEEHLKPCEVVEKNTNSEVGITENNVIEAAVEAEDKQVETNDDTARQLKHSSEKLEMALLDLQHGICMSFEKFTVSPKRDLLMTDFSTIDEIQFSTRGSSIESEGFALRVYAPVAFLHFRKLFDITNEEFKKSICMGSFKNIDAGSSSGSTFNLTEDGRFILKTVPKKDADFLINLFPGYYMNLTQHRKTLLPKYYGLFTHRKGVSVTRVLIMNNILPTSYIFKKYDLKGATYSKRKWLKRESEHYDSNQVTLKDLDFLEDYPDGLFLHHKIYDVLLNAIERDCTVLEKYNIMNYSLLLGVVEPDDRDPPKKHIFKLIHSSRNLKTKRNLIGPIEARVKDGKVVYLFLGIIDILQSYNWKKKIERRVKSLFYNRNMISVNRPDSYSERFQTFLKESVFKRIPKQSSSKLTCFTDKNVYTSEGF